MNKKLKKTSGFTLIEVLISVVVLGIAIAAIIGSNGYFSMASATGADITTAEFLISQIEAITAVLPIRDEQSSTASLGPEEASVGLYDDVDDFDSASFSPPIDSQGQSIEQLSRFSQQITVQNVNPSDFQQVVTDHASDIIKVTVTILADGIEISSCSWLRSAE